MEIKSKILVSPPDGRFFFDWEWNLHDQQEFAGIFKSSHPVSDCVLRNILLE